MKRILAALLLAICLPGWAALAEDALKPYDAIDAEIMRAIIECDPEISADDIEMGFYGDAPEGMAASAIYTTNTQLLVVRAGSEITSVEILLSGEYKVAVKRGSTAEQLLLAENAPGLTIIPCDNLADAAAEMVEGDFDCVVADERCAVAYANGHSIRLKVLPEPYIDLEYRVLASAEDPALIERVDAVLKQLKNERKIREIVYSHVTIDKASFINRFKADFRLNFLDRDRWRYLLDGLWVTLQITLASIAMGVVLGAIVALVRSTYDSTRLTARRGAGRVILKIADSICRVYLTVIRGTPVVIQLMITYYLIFASSRNGVAVAMLAFGINSGAYVAEIIRGGIMSIDVGQTEAGRSLGFGYTRTMLFIIIPQALKNVLPALANEFIVLLKETSVAGYVAVEDLTKGGDIIRGVTYSAFMPLIAVALIYLVLVMFFTKLVSMLERRLRNSDH